MDSLLVPAAILYVFSPLVAVIALSLQIWRFGHRTTSWILLAVSIGWGVIHILNPLLLLMMPAFLAPNHQTIYLVVRAIALITYAGFSIHSIAKRSESSRWTSLALLAALMIDWIGAFFGGRYVGA